MNSITQNFRSKLFAGVATLLPLYLTFFVIKFLFVTLEEMSDPLLKRFNLDIPGLGIILTVLLIYILGFLVTNFLGRKIFNLGERIVKKVPIVNMIYTTLKQITDTFTKGSTDAFEGAVYIQYPRQGLWTMAFISGESKTKDGVPYYHLFVPTTPNPTSGFFLMIPQADTVATGMSVEDGLKTIISGGLLAPDENPLP
ncbi:MAG TPA: DUF502 domain-containing protein [Candidatus Marinimicrobia bacterium]|jgi:uncharacterized membrane protein|nr:hypothetical protein [Candidatus Neomarinimicrobiota bacterium]HIB04388.1 DUF502 domain-containing protein [Candidatus Neomarinimicrobiota bacterium]|tara:strand:- start:3449 stop:4042 length:594 start_codon:yes stop_codon:yes gene_type:complete